MGRRDAPPPSISIVENMNPPMRSESQQGTFGKLGTGTTAGVEFVRERIVEVQEDAHRIDICRFAWNPIFGECDAESRWRL